MRIPSLLTGVVTLLYQVALLRADLVDEYQYSPQSSNSALDGTGNDFLVRSEPATSPDGASDMFDKDAPKRAIPQDISNFWKRRMPEGNQAFWKRGEEVNSFWKRQNSNVMSFWKRFLPSMADGRQSASSFWKRAPSSDLQAFWKRAFDEAPSFWKKSDVEPVQSSLLESHIVPARQTRTIGVGHDLAAFWKRANVPWNMMVLHQYRQQMAKAKQQQRSQDNPLPPKNRRKGPKYNPDFNPTGW